MNSGANKPLILNQKITLGDKKRLSAISGTMWLQYSYIVTMCQEKNKYRRTQPPYHLSASSSLSVIRDDFHTTPETSLWPLQNSSFQMSYDSTYRKFYNLLKLNRVLDA